MKLAKEKTRLAVIGVPFNSAGTTNGVALAPQALQDAGLLEFLAEHSNAIDYGNVEFASPTTERASASGIIAENSLLEMTEALRAFVTRALRENRFPLVIGGDCSLLPGCLAAARQVHNRVGLVFVDGHEDAYPPHASPTGEAADLELGLILGRSSAGFPPELANLLAARRGIRCGRSWSQRCRHSRTRRRGKFSR